MNEALTQELNRKDAESKRLFKLVPKESTKLHFLAELGKLQTAATIWTEDQKLVIQSRCTSMDPDKRTISFSNPKDLDSGKLKGSLASNGEFFFSLSHPSARLFFKSRIRSMSAAYLVFELPDKVFRVQRRHSFRLAMRGFYTMTVDIKDPSATGQIMKKRVLDLSDLGLAFLIGTADESFFKKNMTVKEMQIVVNNRSISFEGEVRHVGPLSKDAKGLSKVGIKFCLMKKDDADYIASWVMAENRKFISNII
jgi:c-di-GMP-binding flagellar brake protein YcgR